MSGKNTKQPQVNEVEKAKGPLDDQAASPAELENQALKQQVAELTKRLAAGGNSSGSDAEKEALKKQVQDLSDKLDNADESKKHKAEVISHNGKKYKVLVPNFQLNQEVCTVADLRKNFAIVRELLDMGSHVIQEIKTDKD